MNEKPEYSAQLARDGYHLAVPLELSRERFLAERGDPVIDAALIVHFRVDLPVAFAYQPGVDHAADRTVEGARSHLYLATRVRFDLLHDPVAMALLRRDGEQDVEHRWSEWGAGLLCDHAKSLYPLRIQCNGFLALVPARIERPAHLQSDIGCVVDVAGVLRQRDRNEVCAAAMMNAGAQQNLGVPQFLELRLRAPVHAAAHVSLKNGVGSR